jgi:hypothetical protein
MSSSSWIPLYVCMTVYVGSAAVAAVLGARTRPEGGWPAWIPAGLQRVTGIPGWAAGMVGTALLGLLVAGIGFYEDVAWHVGLGRDELLFTPPHTMIVVGLGMIAVSAALGVLFATVQRAPVRLRVLGLRIPWSAVPMGLLGLTALGGFPLDELWHQRYGIDVTMWSPTHLLMILGASFSPIAAWMALSEAGVTPTDSRWARGAHVLAAWLVLAGLSSAQGEFEFGVPQFQQLYHPVLVVIAAGVALTAARLVLGPGWALLVGAGSLLLRFDGAASDIDVTTRPAALYVGAAVAVEVAALLLGTDRRRRFALGAAVGVMTLGLGVEWVWNAGAHQPWTASLLPDALLVGGLGALGAAAVGVALGAAVRGERPGLGRAVLAAGGVAVLAALVIPFPRRTGDVEAAVRVERTGAGEALVHVQVRPADAADDARWFQTIAWQGGGFVRADMVEVAPGRYVAASPVPIEGDWKTMVRLHRGAEMMAVPVWLPADPEIGEPEVPAEDRTRLFGDETAILMRESRSGPAGFAVGVYSLLTAVAAAWVVAFVVAGRALARRSDGLELAADEARAAQRPLQLA